MGGYQTVHFCYCQIPDEKLKEISRLRYVEGIPTEELMKRMKTPKEREYVAAVALLDVKPEDLAKAVPNTEPGILRHLFDCRSHVIGILEDAGISIRHS